MKKVKMLYLPSGKSPFLEWMSGLPLEIRFNISAYIKRVSLGGGKKNIKSIGGGLFEIKIDKGPGYRVYFGQVGKVVIVLVGGGDKTSQKRDIKTAKKYWSEYNV